MKNKLVIFAVDDHPIFLKGLIEILQDELTEASIYGFNFPFEALEKAEKLKPNVAVLDLDMPKMNGIVLSKELKNIDPNIKIIMLTMHKEPDIIRSVISKGLDAFVFKDDAVNELSKAIKNVLMDNIYISNPQILNQTKEKSEILASLTKTECKILIFIAENKTSNEIANLLSVSIKTIQNHRNNISKKLQLKGSNSLLKFAISNKEWL